jgi:DNA end-binding protein Ku
MPRAIWSGAISFGLLNVPVKLYSAVSSKKISFKELREGDGARIRHKRVAEDSGEEVPYDKIVKGYELSPDQYVVLTRDELAEMDPKKTRAIEIQDFVDLEEIDPIYYDHPYYLGPDKGAERAYSLLVKAMNDSGKVAIARFVLRSKENLAVIRPMDNVLTMATMRFADEVVQPDDLDDVLPDGIEKPKEQELKMARALIDSLAGDFEPEKYKDEYREELLNLIERKAAGEDVVSPVSEAPEPTKAPDLMAALEESLAAVRGEELGRGSKKAKANVKAGGGGRKRSGTAPKPKRTAKPTSPGQANGKPKRKTSTKAPAKTGTKTSTKKRAKSGR